MKNIIKKILKEYDDEFEFAQNIVNQLKYYEDKESKGYLNAENKRIGLWTFYYENGELNSKGEYIDSIMVGPWEYYYKNGVLSAKGEFMDNERNGLWEYYYNNGQLHSKGRYIDGIQSGLWEYYYSDGIRVPDFNHD